MSHFLPSLWWRAILRSAGIVISNTATRRVNVEIACTDPARIDNLDDHGLARTRPRRPGELEALAAVACLPVASESVRQRVTDDDGLEVGAAVGIASLAGAGSRGTIAEYLVVDVAGGDGTTED